MSPFQVSYLTFCDALTSQNLTENGKTLSELKIAWWSEIWIGWTRETCEHRSVDRRHSFCIDRFLSFCAARPAVRHAAAMILSMRIVSF